MYWGCLNRIENKDKYCKDSVGIEECKLHDAICRAISSAIPEKGEILSAIKSTLEYAETGDENSLNIFNFEQNIATKKEEVKRIMLLSSSFSVRIKKILVILNEDFFIHCESNVWPINFHLEFEDIILRIHIRRHPTER